MQQTKNRFRRNIFPKGFGFSLCALVLLSACSGKPTRTNAPPLLDPRPSEQVSRPFPTDPIQLPPPSDSTPIGEEAAGETGNHSGVVIVAGGVGVSSFGLIGILKRFQTERIKVDAIVTTGWPTIVGLGYGMLRSIHDVEWMVSRLTEKDLESIGSFDTEKKLLDAEKFPKLFESNFGSKEINQTKIPVSVAAVNTDLGKPDTYDRGDWRYPLGKTLSVPGIYRAVSDLDPSDLHAIDISEGQRRGKIVVVLNFYEDFWDAVDQSKLKLSSTVEMKAYVKQLKADFKEQAKEATLVGKVTIGKDFDDLSFRRLAIVSGYQEGQRLAKAIRNLRK